MSKVNGAFTYQAWVDGIRAGRTFVTTGPMLFLLPGTGFQPGDTIRANKGDQIDVRSAFLLGYRLIGSR